MRLSPPVTRRRRKILAWSRLALLLRKAKAVRSKKRTPLVRKALTGAQWTGGAERCNIGLLLGRCGSGTLLEAVGPAKFLAESLEAASSVHKLLLSGEKRVAIAANIDVDSGQGAARREGVSACTVNRTGLIARMNFFFHGHYSFGWNVRLATHGRTSVQRF